MRNEIQSLRLRIAEQEEVLQGTIQRLRNTNRTKESMEAFIVNQCEYKVSFNSFETTVFSTIQISWNSNRSLLSIIKTTGEFHWSWLIQEMSLSFNDSSLLQCQGLKMSWKKLEPI